MEKLPGRTRKQSVLGLRSHTIKGKQYFVIAAGGGGISGTKAGDAYIAFKIQEYE